MIAGCTECEFALVMANMSLAMQGECWLVHHCGHSHGVVNGSDTKAHLVHMTRAEK